MKWALVVAFGPSLLLSSTVFAQSSKPGEPVPLDETLSWMRDTLQRGGIVGYGRYSEKSEDGRGLWITTTLAYTGCTLTFEREEVDTRLETRVDSSRTVFKLRDIDPTTIDVKPRSTYPNRVAREDDEGEVFFFARNARESIRKSIRGKARVTKKVDHDRWDTSWDSIPVGSLEYAYRFAKAFRRAIELCGGKPSAF